ncbi:hypothetical protein GGR56DRAFT_664684 [Xylariaceae sp. FL0804]|nr:hypothetical protein GGR56DRAFT_664684 [Xylariaceae sp. FL0804]
MFACRHPWPLLDSHTLISLPSNFDCPRMKVTDQTRSGCNQGNSNKVGSATDLTADTEVHRSDHAQPGETELQPSARQKRYDVFLWDKWKQENRAREAKLGPSLPAEQGGESAAWLVKDAQSKRIISSPREYQTELFERAKQKNIIAVLDTGTGKTLIAALLLRHTIEQEFEDRSNGKPQRLSFFLVDKNALVHQQYEVFHANLDHPVARFSGQLLNAQHTRSFWEEQCRKHQVIVCTAAILHACLHHSFVKMEQINLLVFDEAHHAKKNHPYARIIKDFYATLEQADQRRPRILGMTASPVDAKTNVHVAAAQLEGLLHCEIATVADPTMFSTSSNDRPESDFVEYSKVEDPFETPLWQKLHKIVGHNRIFAKLFTYSRNCTTELGRWCADQMWQICLTKEVTQLIEAKTERNFTKTGSANIAELDAERAAVREAYQAVVEHDFSEFKNDPFHVSNKVSTLIMALQKNLDPKSGRCVVFAEERLTVRLLYHTFKQASLGLHHVMPGMLIGNSNDDVGDAKMSLREQLLTVRRLRQGELNCVFATSVAEEGVDIPDCNLIIRFDICKTLIQYIQSRGRARQKHSRFLHMVDVGNPAHAQSLLNNEDDEAKLRQFCSTLPENRLITGNDYNLDFFLSKEKRHRTYTVKATGAKLTYKASPVILANFVASLPHPLEVHNTVDYTIRNVGGDFECEVILPDSSPIRNAIGRRASSKQVAKCSAAFEMCLKLKAKKYLDDDLLSTFSKRLPALRNARLAINSKKQKGYPMRTKPEIWSIRGSPGQLFVTVFRLSNPAALEKPSMPIALLTREPLPQLAPFPLFFGDQRMSMLECIPVNQAFHPLDEEVEALNQFTLRVFRDVFSKEYESDAKQMPYFIAPVTQSHEADLTSSVADCRILVDWECVFSVRNAPGNAASEYRVDHDFESRFVNDPFDGSRKFYTVRNRPDLKPTDIEPTGTPKSRGWNRQKTKDHGPLDIWNFSISLYKNSRTTRTIRHDLPVVEVELVSHRRNLLDEFELSESTARRCYVVFETLELSPLPVNFVAMVYNLPAIVYRLDSTLIALDACKRLDLDISPELALEAMTKDSDNTDEHDQEKVNFQGGMGKNYERLEFLGDTFLKMSTTIALFILTPDSTEFHLHCDRMSLIVNQNLFNNALEDDLQEYIRTKGFQRRLWYPDGLVLLRGKKSDHQGEKHSLADKSIADVCEALIGAAYMMGREAGNFDLAVRAVTRFVRHRYHTMTSWAEYAAAYTAPAWQTEAARAVQVELARQVEAKLPGVHRFAHPRLLRSAFTHPSYGSLYEGLPSYQRLEFLGDALLDMACVDHLFARFPGADPQWLTEHKMAMVSNQFLGCLAAELGLHRHLLAMSPALQREVLEYVAAIGAARDAAATTTTTTATISEDDPDGEGGEGGGGTYARDFWVNAPNPPKCLPDMVEAYIGAVFVDGGFDFAPVQRFFDAHVRPYFADMSRYDTYASRHPVTLLTSLLGTRFRCARWRIMVDEADGGQGDGDAGGPGAFSSRGGEQEGEVEDGGSGSGERGDREGEGEEGGVALLLGGRTGTRTRAVCGVMVHGAVRAHATAASARYAKTRAAAALVRVLGDMDPPAFRRAFGCDCRAAAADTAAADAVSAAAAAVTL